MDKIVSRLIRNKNDRMNFYSQDLQAFSNDNFDAVEWINNTFRSVDSEANKETIASNMAFKLQLFVQEVNNSLEETAQQMLHNLPKVMREAEPFQQEAIQLNNQIKAVKDKLDYESSGAMKNLIAIDTVKTRMEETCKALQEADNWTTLSSDVEDVFKTGDTHIIAHKLIGMQKSLEILVDVPDYEQRIKHLEELKDRFESMIEIATVRAFTLQSNETAHIYVKMFKDLKRIANLKRYYHNCIKTQLINEWGRIIQIDPEEDVLDWLNSFYDFMLSTWHSQSNFCTQIMFHNDIDSTLDLLCDIFIEVLNNLNPNFLSSIIKLLNQQTNYHECLNILIETRQIIERFAKSIELSINNTGNHRLLQKVQVNLFAEILYLPFRDLIERYEGIETKALLSDLETVKSISQPSESLNKAFLYAKEAEKRCHQLSYSVAFPILFNILEKYFNDLIQHFQSRIDHLRSKSLSSENKSSIPDWSLFQLSLFNLQASGEFTLQLESFRQQLFASIKDVQKKIPTLYGPNSSPFQRYHQLILSPSMKSQFLELKNICFEDDTSPILSRIHSRCKEVCCLSANVVLEVALSYIQVHLDEVANIASMSDEKSIPYEEDMHPFSLSPQEYITQVGQYLLTIPQHIEPFIIQENNAFKIALSNSELKSTNKNMISTENNAAEFLLDCITQGTIDAFISRILKMKKLNAISKQQLVTDIGYLNDVLDDLGLSPGEDLQKLHSLLKASPEQLKTIAKESNSMLVKGIQHLIE